MTAQDERFNDLQRSFFENADVEHFRWQTANTLIGATERELLSGFPLPPGGCVLEVGCGEGGNIVNLVSSGAMRTAFIVGLDLFERKVAFAAREVDSARFVCGDALALPFRNHAFDSVLCRDLLHHVERRGGVLAELRRICKPGGDLWIIEPNGRNALMVLLAAVRPHERGLLRNSVKSLRKLVATYFVATELETRQPMPIYRLLLHHRFVPRLGEHRFVRWLILGFEAVLRRVLPGPLWAYIVIRIKT